jgi:hypothetical protein
MEFQAPGNRLLYVRLFAILFASAPKQAFESVRLCARLLPIENKGFFFAALHTFRFFYA